MHRRLKTNGDTALYRESFRDTYLEDEFQSEPMDEISYEGETIEMRCDPPRGEPAPTVYWLKDNKRIDTTSETSRFKLANDFSLLILATRKEDSGKYVCVATNQVHTIKSKPAKLTLLDSSKKYFWSEWSDWSICSAKCGPGTIKRFRTCQTTDKQSQTQNVSISMCGIGPSVEDQPCNLRKCKENKPHKHPDVDRHTSTPISVVKQSQDNQPPFVNPNNNQTLPTKLETEHISRSDFSDSSLFPWDKSLLSFLSGITAGLIFLSILVCLLMVLFRYRRRRKAKKQSSELNLYYTCEKQQTYKHGLEDDFTMFKFTKGCAARGVPEGINCTGPIFSSSSSSPSTATSSSTSQVSSCNINSYILKQQTTPLLNAYKDVYCTVASPISNEISTLIYNNNNHPNHNTIQNSVSANHQTNQKMSKAVSQKTCFMKNVTQKIAPNQINSNMPSFFIPINNKNANTITSGSVPTCSPLNYQNTSSNDFNAHNLCDNNLTSPHPSTVYYATPFQNQNQPPQLQTVGTPSTTTKFNRPANSSFKIVSISNKQFLKDAIIISPTGECQLVSAASSNHSNEPDQDAHQQRFYSVGYTNLGVGNYNAAESLNRNAADSTAKKYRYEEQDELAYDIADPLSIQSKISMTKKSTTSSSGSSSASATATNSTSLQSSPSSSATLSHVQTIPSVMKSLFNSLHPDDICAGNVGPSGAKLSLQSGVSLIVPEGAIPADQESTFIYLGLCREDSYKPRLNDKNTHLSEVVMIGPPNLVLQKPVILLMEHCAHNITQDWNVKLYSAYNSYENQPEWQEEDQLNSDTNSINHQSKRDKFSNNVFLNATESHFVLMTEKLGRFSLTGESSASRKNSNASKFFRLVAFCSSSITNNDFNLRIYCVDSLKLALEEIQRDEIKIGGTILDRSDPFLISHSNISESLTISIDQICTRGWNCKYNVNKQDIPLNHIWNGRNHLLHCSFTLERNDVTSEIFSCKINAYQSNSDESTSPIEMNINYDLTKFFTRNTKELENDSSLFKSYSNGHKISSFSKNRLSEYLKIEKNVKNHLCNTLDYHDSNNRERNLKSLASRLDIDRDISYFNSKPSPTELLLLYFEALNNIDTSTQDTGFSNHQVNQPKEQFSETFGDKPKATSSHENKQSTQAPFNFLLDDIKYHKSFIDNFIEKLSRNDLTHLNHDIGFTDL